MSGELTGEALKKLRHDLRTPINHILGYTDMLVEDAAEIGIAAFVEPLRKIRAGGRTLLELIQSSLGEGMLAVNAEAMTAFVGVHPKFTQEPPRSLRSASATLFPAFASACASGMPACPPPIIRTS